MPNSCATSLPRKGDSFFGRRHGPSLNYNQKLVLHDLLPLLKLDLLSNCPQNLAELFNKKSIQGIVLEIGFGGGEHLLHSMNYFPNMGFIGVEPFVNSMAKFLTKIKAVPSLQEQVKVFDDDATLLLDWLPANSLDRIDIFYPDPWPKKKHWKRRFIQNKNLDRFARVLKPKGQVRFASDIAHYVNWTLFHFKRHKDFHWLCPTVKNWQIPFEDWVTTRYEAKAILAKRPPTYLSFERI